MKAKWKDKPLDQIQPSKRQRDIAMLQQQIRVLEEEIKKQTAVRQQAEHLQKLFREEREEFRTDAYLLDALLKLEVMVPTKEGFKLLTGNEMREYLKSKTFGHSIAISLTDMREALLPMLKNMFNYEYTRSQSQKADQENP